MSDHLCKPNCIPLLLAYAIAFAVTGLAADEPDTSDSDEAPFENVVDPDSKAPRWAISLSTGRSWSNSDTFSTSQTAVLSRAIHVGPVVVTPRVGIWHQADQPVTNSYKSASAGTNVSWSPHEDHSFSLDAVWTTVDGPDSWESISDWSYDHELSEIFSVQAGGWAGWSKDQRGSSGATLGSDLSAGAFTVSMEANYTRRLESYYDVFGEDKSSYINAFGWSAGIDWSIGKWSIGPSWVGERWTANTSGIPPALKKTKGVVMTKLAKQTARIPASGVVLSQSLGWNTTWRMFPGMHLSLGLVKNFGTSKTTTNAKRANVQAVLTRQGQNPIDASDSYGASLGYAFSW